MKTISIDYDEYKNLIDDQQNLEKISKDTATIILVRSVNNNAFRQRYEATIIETKNIAKEIVAGVLYEDVKELSEKNEMLIKANENLIFKVNDLESEIKILSTPTPHQKRGWWF